MERQNFSNRPQVIVKHFHFVFRKNLSNHKLFSFHSIFTPFQRYGDAAVRWRNGVASSLNYIENSNEKSPILHPYPSWEMNQLNEQQQSEIPNIVSSFGIRGDSSQFEWIFSCKHKVSSFV